jgi:amidohydrolase
MTSSQIADLKSQVRVTINQHRTRLITLGRNLHDHPEIALQEHKALQWLTDDLKSNNFTVNNGIYDMPTAFYASYGKGNPKIALLAEYDALPGLGHACGHNLIATAAVAAAIGAKAAVNSCGGTVMVIGTPAEELEGGKIAMVKRGAFSDINVAMMVHPSSYDTATIKALACIPLNVEFIGRESHAAAHPEMGINALEAMIQAYNAINSLRQHIIERARIHGVITDGGKAANIVPGYSAGRFLVRADDASYLEELRTKVLKCFQGAAMATGARLEYRWNEKELYSPMRNNLVLAQLYIQNMAILGHAVPLANPNLSFGSTDMGNVSQVVPAIHAECAIAPQHIGVHTPEFAALAYEERSFDSILEAASGLAMTVIDLLAEPDKLNLVRQEFHQMSLRKQ